MTARPPPCFPRWLEMRTGAVIVRVRAKPGSSRRGILRVAGDAVVIGLNAPPEKGRANDELIEILARSAGVPRSSLAIVRGTGSRDKLIAIATNQPEAIFTRLIGLVEAQSKQRSIA